MLSISKARPLPHERCDAGVNEKHSADPSSMKRGIPLSTASQLVVSFYDISMYKGRKKER